MPALIHRSDSMVVLGPEPDCLPPPSCLLTVGFIAAPFALLFDGGQYVMMGTTTLSEAPWMGAPMFVVGALMLFFTLHIARGVGRLHGQLAKHLLVRTSQYA